MATIDFSSKCLLMHTSECLLIGRPPSIHKLQSGSSMECDVVVGVANLLLLPLLPRRSRMDGVVVYMKRRDMTTTS